MGVSLYADAYENRTTHMCAHKLQGVEVIVQQSTRVLGIKADTKSRERTRVGPLMWPLKLFTGFHFAKIKNADSCRNNLLMYDSQFCCVKSPRAL